MNFFEELYKALKLVYNTLSRKLALSLESTITSAPLVIHNFNLLSWEPANFQFHLLIA